MKLKHPSAAWNNSLKKYTLVTIHFSSLTSAFLLLPFAFQHLMQVALQTLKMTLQRHKTSLQSL